ncbi:Chromatin assembly complex subunit, putative (Chromatin assembly factor (Caf) subunit, putative), partial [Candida maltosa Xu316]
LSKPAIAVSFSPIKYKLNGESTIKVPYKLVFAVALQDGVVIYSTQDNFKPLGFVSNLHYSSITDLKWDNDGSRIIISSTDGFCSHVVFEKDVFGEPCEDQTFAVPTTTTTTSEPEKVSPAAKNEADEIVVDEVPKEPEPPKTNNDNTPSIDTFFGKNQKVKKRIAPTLIQQ